MWDGYYDGRQYDLRGAKRRGMQTVLGQWHMQVVHGNAAQ